MGMRKRLVPVLLVATMAGGAAALGLPAAAEDDLRLAQAGPAPSRLTDPVAERTFREYTTWPKVSEAPVKSEGHGDRWVVTYLNPRGERAGLTGSFPFPEGTILAKESFQDAGGRPGTVTGPLYIMEKRRRGYDPQRGDWHYAMVNPDGRVAMSGSGDPAFQTHLCAECHDSSKVNDYVFGTKTRMKVK